MTAIPATCCLHNCNDILVGGNGVPERANALSTCMTRGLVRNGTLLAILGHGGASETAGGNERARPLWLMGKIDVATTRSKFFIRPW